MAFIPINPLSSVLSELNYTSVVHYSSPSKLRLTVDADVRSTLLHMSGVIYGRHFSELPSLCLTPCLCLLYFTIWFATLQLWKKIIRWIWQRTMQTHYMPEFVDILHSVCRQVQPFYIKVIESVIVHFIWTQLHFVHIIQASVWLRYCGLDL